MILVILPPLMAPVSATVLALLLSGGIVYSLGVIVRTGVRIAFHNAAWTGIGRHRGRAAFDGYCTRPTLMDTPAAE